MKNILIFLLSILYFFSSIQENTINAQQKLKKIKLNKFEPKNGEFLFFIGQDLNAVGGFKRYNEGYIDTFTLPAGVTVYTNLSAGGKSFGYNFKGLDGIKTKVNWGAGDTSAQYYIDNPKFKNSLLSIGLSLVNAEKNIAKEKNDHLIIEFGEWIKKVKKSCIFKNWL